MENYDIPQNAFEALGIGDSFGSDREAVLMLLGAMLLTWGLWWISTILFAG